MINTYRRLGELLVGNGAITNLQLSVALADQRVSNRRLGDILIERGFTTEADIARCLAEQYNYPLADLDSMTCDPDALETLSAEDALQLRALPIAYMPEGLIVAICDPIDVIATDRLAAKIGQRVVFQIAPSGVLVSHIRAAYGLNDEFAAMQFAEAEKAPRRYRSLVAKMKFGSVSVFDAIDEPLDRPVTIACMPVSDENAIDQFKAVRAAAKETAEAICAIHDSFIEEGYRWTIMHALPGENLERVLRVRGPRTVPQAADLVSKVAEALDTLQRLEAPTNWACPANIFIGSKIPQLAPIVPGPDSYLPSAHDREGASSSEMTVYSLGCLLKDCLYGLDRKGTVDIPTPMEEILANCLAIDSKDRYASAIEVASALRAFNWPALSNPIGRSTSVERQQLLDTLDDPPGAKVVHISFWQRLFGRKSA